jgi:hypothetical protein
MASWKKIIVSGSSANLAALSVDNLTSGQVVIGGGSASNLSTTAINGTGNILATTGATGVSISGSFSGSFFGDGSGLTGITATTITANTNITDLATTDFFFVSSSSGLVKITYANVVTDLAGAGLVSADGGDSLAVGAGTGITVNADDVQLKNAGSLTNNVLTKWDSSNGQLVNSGLTDDGTNLGIARNTSVTGFLSATGAITGSAVSASGTVQGLVVSAAQSITAGSFIQAGTNITAPSGYISAGSPAGAPNSIGAVQGQIGFFNTLSVTGGGSIGGNLTVTGDLTVAGTASFTNVDNLTVKDKFILINSGSTTLADSGWVTQYNAAGSGSAFYLEASSTGTYGRFAMAYDVIGTSTAVSADEYVVSAKSAAGAPAAAPTWGGSGNGFGNVYVNSSNGDIYMYS